jgi:hypothetical protein
MGKRLHVVKQQERYGSSEYFNWKYNEFADLLTLLDCDVCSADEFNKERFEVPTKDFEQAMEYVKQIKEGKTDFEYIDVEDLDFEELGGIDNVLEAMEGFYKQRDKKSEWMIFVAW